MTMPRVIPPIRERLAVNRSTRWAFMEKFEVPNYDADQGNYLTRIRIVQTPVFGIYLHRFDGPDPRDTLHDHPWSFTSIVLRGGYVERRLDPNAMEVNEHCTVRFINRKRPHNAHAIIRLLRVPTWTLVIVGRRVRTWGYWEQIPAADVASLWGAGGSEPVDEDRTSWRWTEFDKHLHADEFAASLERRAQR